MQRQKTKILYCDDQLPEQPERVKMLERKGFDVDPALDGTTCMKLLRKNKYDALILDIMMDTGGEIGTKEAHKGYQTGLVVLRRIRRELCPDIPVVVVTAYPGGEAREEILNDLAVPRRCYLEKPVPSAVVIERLEEALAKRKEHA